MTADGVPKLLDFGIAKLLDPAGGSSATGLTAAGARLMTPSYASPEQVRGGGITTATDVFSLGAVLYEVLTGRQAHPVDTSSAISIEKEICAREPPKPSTANKAVDTDLDNIVLMALRTEPQRRYASAVEFSGDLERFLCNLPVLARKESLSYRARKFLKRNRIPTMASAVSAVIVLALAGGVSRFIGGSGEGEVRSIAVLPLDNLSGDPEQEYFAEGMTDGLIASLSKIHKLRVISRTSAMAYRRKSKPIIEIARELGVQATIQGSVIHSAGHARIQLKLIETLSGRQIWANTYERPVPQTPALQNDAALDIAREIHAQITPLDHARLANAQAVNQRAYDAYLKGRFQYLNEFTKDSVRRAMARFQEALAADPRYAPAYAGMADCYYMISAIYYPPNDVMPKAKWAAQKALEIDSSLGEAQATLALVQSLYDWNRKEAEKGFRRAIELNPNNVLAHLWYAIHLLGMARGEEALAELERARELDPVSPGVNVYTSGAALYFLRRYDQMVERLRQMVDMDPNQNMPHAFLGLAYEQRREYDKAIAELQRAYRLDDETVTLAQLGHVYAIAGKTAEAERILARLKQLSGERYVSVYDIGLLYAGLGRKNEAFQWFEMFHEDRSEWFAMLRVDPRLDPIRNDPRFVRLLSRIDSGP